MGYCLRIVRGEGVGGGGMVRLGGGHGVLEQCRFEGLWFLFVQVWLS